jgi:hypothetical protein
MRGAEVERFEGVERGLMGLIRLWKFVEKSEAGRTQEPPTVCKEQNCKRWALKS